VGWDAGGSLWVRGDGSGRLAWSAQAGGDASPSAGRRAWAGGSLLWRVVDRLRLQAAPNLRWAELRTQYVTALDGTAGGAATFGTRYLFGELGLRQASVQLRAQLALGPDLTIDAYAEPFASAGRYRAFGELPRPRATWPRRYDDGAVVRGDGQVRVDDDGDAFAFADPDFTVRSLRSTVVLRWELRPGSVLYAVWQQDRGAGHLLAVKLAYWWTP
jgi:hypothetical protein